MISSLTSFFEACNHFNVLIIGDVMVDRYHYGSVSRISPEAPVPVVELQQTEDRLGGAANVALNVQAMGAKALLCGLVGQDEAGRRFMELLSQQDLDTTGILTSSFRKTTIKTRIIAHNQQLLRLDSETTQPLDTNIEQLLLQKVKFFLSERRIHVIIFQDYNKGVLTAGLIQAVSEIAREQNIPTTVDPKFENFWIYRGVTLFKPNWKEMRNQSSQPFEADEQGLKMAAEEVFQRLQTQYLMITLSEKGIFFAGKKGSFLASAKKRAVADVSGAGDTVISLASLALAYGLPEEQIAFLCNLAGGQVVEKVGVVPVDKGLLIKECFEEGRR